MRFKNFRQERALTPAEKEKMGEYEKKIDIKDFIDRYGEEEGKKIYYATITKMAKKNEAVSPAQQAAIAIAKKEKGMKEDAPRWIKDLIGNKMHPKQYAKALEILKQILDRKEKEAGGKKNMKHGASYYAAQVARQFKNVDARNLAKMVQESNMNEEVTQKQLNDLEKFADRILAKFEIDVEFTRHFADRMNDKRNSPEIKIAELQKLFKKIAQNKAKNIKGNPGIEAVLKDLSSDLNLPVVIKVKKDGEIELVNKTIMRKPDFKTTSKVIKYEEWEKMDEASRADMKIRKRPHMMLKAGNQGVKFDGRFKMFKKKQMLRDDEKPLEESFDSIEEQIFDLMESTETLFNRNEEMELEEKRDPRKSGGSGYDLYHKDFSSAMQHAYKYAKEKLGVDIDPKEIDDKVASGPRKPSSGKTNSYRLTDKSGKKAVQIQVYNMDNKKYELNMYKEDMDVDFDALMEEVLTESANVKKAIDKAHKFFVKTSKGRSERIQEKNRFAAMEMLKKELEKAGVDERDQIKAFGELDNHITKVMDESVQEELKKDKDDPCWKDYVQVGTKKKNGKEVPNCVPKEEVEQVEEAKKDPNKLDPKDVEAHLVKKGVNPKDAKDAVKKGFGYANKKYGGPTYAAAVKKVAEVIWSLHEDLEGLDVLEEGINDPGIFKAVFLAGGPGSGKSFMVGKTALTALGLKLINSDPAFEAQLKKVGLKATPEDIFTDKGQAARNKAKSLTKKQQELALNGRLGLVIDGTGKDYDKIQKQAIALKKLGYEVGMIFVNTNLETAIARDAARDRTLGAKEVTKMWNAVQDNIGKFQKFFGTSMIIVDNSNGADWETGVQTAYKKMSKWVAQKPKSPMAKKWIDSQKKQRGITEEDQKVLEYGKPETTETFKKMTPGEKIATNMVNKLRK